LDPNARGAAVKKLWPIKDDAGATLGWGFYCPGCEHGHVFYVRGALTWTFNGNEEKPTFDPSLLNTCPNHHDPTQRRCHLNLVNGELRYHADSTHAYAGNVVPLEGRPH
jgi:hypothetical protein